MYSMYNNAASTKAGKKKEYGFCHRHLGLAICYTILILPRPGQPWPYYTLLNKFGQGQQKRPASLLLTHGRPNPKDLMYIKAGCRARMFS